MQVVLLGAPGSGKGTQGVVLARHLGVPFVSSGELLRAHVARGSELGRQIEDCIARGELVPDDLVLAVVGDALTGAAEAGGYVLDGFPRTLAQAEQAYALAEPAGLLPMRSSTSTCPTMWHACGCPGASKPAAPTTRTHRSSSGGSRSSMRIRARCSTSTGCADPTTIDAVQPVDEVR